MENWKNKVFLIIILGLFIVPNFVHAVPQGTIFFKTGASGKMYGYNEFDFSLIPGKTYFGGVAIYLGKDRITKENKILALTQSGISEMPAKYFVDLSKGEKFLGAKIPKGFTGDLWDIASNMSRQQGEKFDITYHKQKGPQSGDWTSVGFVEKIFESASSKQLAYHSRQSDSPDLYHHYSNFDITPDGYDDKSIINEHGDVFSKTKEFSKIHALTENDDIKRVLSGEAKKAVNSYEKIAKNIYGKTFNKNRYFFFPYTQFIQPTLKEVNIGDMIVASKNIPERFKSASTSQKLLHQTTYFSERAILVYGKEGVKDLITKSIGITKDIKKIAKVYKKTRQKVEEIETLVDKAENEKAKKQKRVLKRKAQASLQVLSQTKKDINASINESLEFMDLVEKGYIGDKENREDKERELELQINRLAESEVGGVEEQSKKRQLGETTEVNVLEEQVKKEVERIEGSQGGDNDKEDREENVQEERNIFKEEPKKLDNSKDDTETEEKIVEKSKEDDQKDKDTIDKKSFNKLDIVINEFLPSPKSGQKEWIELYNNSNTTIDLNNWTIEDNTENKESLKGEIGPNDFLVLKQSQDFNFYLNNSGDQVVLKFKDKVIDRVTYGNFNDAGGNNVSAPNKGNGLAREQDGKTGQNKEVWRETSILTPGVSNKIEITKKQSSSGGSSSGGSSSNENNSSDGQEEEETEEYESFDSLDIVISEIAWMGTQASVYDEWIELYNNTDTEINLNGWIIESIDGSPEISLQGKIPSKSFFLIERIDDTTISNIEADMFFSGSLSNEGEKIYLKDGNKNIIDGLDFKDGWVEGQNSDKSSMERIDLNTDSSAANWQTCSLDNPFSNDKDGNFIQGTPKDFSSNSGFQIQSQKDGNDQDGSNSTTDENDADDNANNQEDDKGREEGEGDDSNEGENNEKEIQFNKGDIIINEVLPSPIDDNLEKIEIYNYTTSTISLINWTIEDNTENKESLKGEIGPNDFLVLKQSQDFNFYLNNSGDQIILKFKDKLIDSMTYGDFNDGNMEDNAPIPEKGNSLARENYIDTDIDEDDFYETTTQTFGEKNIISLPDRSPPEITIFEKPDSITNDTNAVFEFNSNEKVDYVCSLNNQEGGDCNSPKEYTNLSDGEHKFLIKATDQAGNISQQNYRWTIDTKKPISYIDTDINATNTLPDKITGTVLGDNIEGVEIQLQKGENSRFLKKENSEFIWIENNSQLWVMADFNPGDKTWVFNLPKSIMTEDFYYIRSRAVDKSGNISEILEKEFVFDKTPPSKIENINLSAKDNLSKLEVTWSKPSDNLSEVDYYKLSYNGYTTTTPVNIFTLDVENKTNYNIKLKAFDKASNASPWSEEKQKLISTSESIIINEVQVANKEFIELYNLSDKEISLNGWYCAYYSSNQNWDGATNNNPGKNKPYRLKQFPDSAKIKAKGYYLIGVHDFLDISVDWQMKTKSGQPYSSSQLSNNSGSVALYNINPEGKSSNFLRKNAIDVLGWGDTQVFETEPVNSPPQNKSLQRIDKKDMGNNNIDFTINSRPDPQNSVGNWIMGWQRRNILLIDNIKNSNQLDDYQIQVKVDYKEGMKSDFSDIKFTSSDGLSLLDYFMESYIDNQSAIFWLKVKKIPAYGEVKIYSYYDNNQAQYTGSGESVFLWYDDFRVDSSSDYNYYDANWNTNKGIVTLGADWQNYEETGFISPKDLKMKNLYIKTKIYLNEASNEFARDGFIEYRHNASQEGKKSSYMYGLVNSRKSIYSGLSLTKKTKDSLNFIKEDNGYQHQYNKWGILEIDAYESEHSLNFHFIGDNFSGNNIWHYSSHYNNQSGNIYFKGENIDSRSGVKLDYIMVGKTTKPKPQARILEDSVEYIPKVFNSRSNYEDFKDWGVRKKIKIINQGVGRRINNIVKFDLIYKEKMNLNFSDLRFTDSNKTSFLSYWFENYSGEYGKEKVTVWLKIPEIQANSYKEIYMYYNNPSATYQGNPKKVFLWYDDFSFDSSNSYLSYDASWNTNKGIVTLGADWQNYEETGFISPKDLKMKNLYIKAKIFLNETSDDLARDGFIEYRHNINDDNKETSWIYGMANSRRTGYNGLTLTKKTKNYLNFIKQDNGYQRQYDKWFNLEVFAYETKHKLGLVPLSDNAGERITWQKYSHHNNQPGSIYFKGENIDSRSGLKLDHIMIGKYKDPNLKVILPEKDFNFESISYNEYPFKGWANQDKITVKNTGNVTSTSSVIKINIDYKEGMHKDFSDVRFVNSDNNQKLPYWNESYVEKESALFWIKIPSIDSGEIKNIDLYYNNPSAVYRGNPKEVFIWYEDFETNSINENINIITQNIDLSTETGEVEIKDNSGILNANLNLKNIYIKARFRLLHEKEDNWIKGGEGTNVAMIDYRFQDYNNFWSFGINNNGICKNDSCYYGPNLNITELGQGFSYWLPPARKIYHDWLNFSAKINDNNHNVGYFTEEDDPSDEIKRELSILDNGINKAGAVRIMVEDSEFRGARFDYILVAPYNPDLKINY